jgi:predicted small secreted protein
MNKKKFIIGFFLVIFGVLLGMFGGYSYQIINKNISKNKNFKIIQKITDSCPIYGSGNKLDSLTFLSSDKKLIFNYSFLDIQVDSTSDVTPFSISPLFLFTGFDTTFYFVLTQKEKEFLFNKNIISSRIYSVDNRFIAIGKPGQRIELLPEITTSFYENDTEANQKADDIESQINK